MKTDHYVAVSYMNSEGNFMMNNVPVSVDYSITLETINKFHDLVAETIIGLDSTIVKETVTIINCMNITAVEPYIIQFKDMIDKANIEANISSEAKEED